MRTLFDILAIRWSLLLFFIPMLSQGQVYDPNNPPNTYQNADNPNYWRNKRPFSDYWQQDVYYRIDADIDEQKDVIDGKEVLTYWNNSPDTLHKVYFHLYQNAFQPGSYYDDLLKANGRKPRYGKYESQGLGTTIGKLKVNGKEAETHLDNTILKVELPEPLKSGDKVKFTIDFKTYFDQGSVRRRMKLFSSDGYKHYNGVHWYPRISVYDRKFGWTTDQHLGKEFYGDFGTFDVELTFASNFIVQATGNLLNEKKVLPDSLRKAIDISNFKDKPWNSKPSVVIPYDSTKRKTWKFYAENVHDFAFTADPTYRMDTAVWKGIECIALVREPHASGWTNAASYTKKIIRTFSEEVGMYRYPKIIVADARDGMEYPMLTLDGGRDPGYRSLLVHEVAHNWFFGMVGTNETYRAAMDEGFTQFLTARGLELIDGDTMVTRPQTKLEAFAKDPVMVRPRNVYLGYLLSAIKDEGARLNQHSDDFNSALGHGGGYRQVYYKMATMLFNLEYVLGDSLFKAALKNYFQEWRMAHPYFEYFKRSVIQFTGVDLNWFFDQWWNSTKRIDFAVKRVRKGEDPNTFRITLERKGEMQMPLDVRLISKEDSVLDVHIPNTWFVKETDAEVLEKWVGWGHKLNTEYTFEVKVHGGIEEVIIDPSGRLADINRRNNTRKCHIDHDPDLGISQLPDHETYELATRPALWYNSMDGAKLGVHVEGDYMEYKDRISATVWMNTSLLDRSDLPEPTSPVSYNLTYRTGLEEISNGLSVELASRWLDGFERHRGGFDQTFGREKNNTFSFDYSAFRRPSVTDRTYSLYEEYWSSSNYAQFVDLEIAHTYHHHAGHGDLSLGARFPGFFTPFDQTRFTLEAKNGTRIGPLKLRSRLFGQYGDGSTLAPEAMLYLAGGNPVSMMDNPLSRSKAFIPRDWTGYGINTRHFHPAGGLGLRGYSGYLAPVKDPERDTVVVGFRGNSGASINLELEFQRLIGFRPPILSRNLDWDAYLFMDAGIIDVYPKEDRSLMSPLRMDAGIGTALSLERIGPITDMEPITLRLDVPLFLNRTPATDPEFLQFRWVFGVERSF